MYGKSTALAVIFAAVTALDEPAPVPEFPDYLEFSAL